MRSLQEQLFELEAQLASMSVSLETLERTQRLLSSEVLRRDHPVGLRERGDGMLLLQVLDDLLFYTVEDLKIKSERSDVLLNRLLQRVRGEGD